ncbi:MAG TPA: hypothetical protein VL993_00795 [Stellaceae bacterium]|nr:hypothetical protein [Stellaceae bacterium]
MATIFVARSASLGKWASDVGLGKHIYKVGVTDEPVKPLVAAGWAGETDWQLVKSQPVDGASEAAVFEQLARKVKVVDPKYYPRIKNTSGLYKVDPVNVENHILVTRVLADTTDPATVKLKPADFAVYLIHNALR